MTSRRWWTEESDPRQGLRTRFLVLLAISMISSALSALAEEPSGAVIRMDWPDAEKATMSWPVAAGVPFGRDSQPNLERAQLVDDRGKVVPAQWRVLQRWHPQGGARWLSVEFMANPDVRAYRFAPSEGAGQGRSGIKTVENRDTIEIDTGPLRAEIPKRGGGGMFRRVWLNGRMHCENADGAGHYLVDQNGVEYRASRDNKTHSVRVERGGPVHTVVRADGAYVASNGKAKCRYIARLHFYYGKPFVRLQHTFLFTENSADLQIRDLGARMSLPNTVTPKTAEFDADAKLDSRSHKLPLSASTTSASLVQDVYYHLGQPKSHWGLYVTKGGKERKPRSGGRAGNWCTLSGTDAAVSVVLKNFWQEFPKELEVRGRSIVTHLWSSRRGNPLDFRVPAVLRFWGEGNIDRWRKERLYIVDHLEDGRFKTNAKGLAKTHEVLYYFHRPDANANEAARHFSRPPLAYPDPAWTAATDAVGVLSPRDPERFPKEEQALDIQLDELHRLVREWGNYGWWEHGAGPHLVYRMEDDKPFGQPKRYTGGCEYWFTRALWTGYLRSGDRRYFHLAAPRMRHFMDVVMCHMDSDTRCRGDFYWSPGLTPIHWGGSKRTELNRNATAGVCAQFGWSVAGLLYYYYLTGDDRAWDVVQEYADLYRRILDYPEWVDDALNKANIMWSRKVFGILDELSILYMATGDEAFSRLARALAAKALRPDLDGGIHREPQFQGEKKLYPKPYAIYYKTPCVVRYWRATGDPLGKDTVRRMVKYDYETAGWHTSFPGVRYVYAWLYGGPDSYVACGKHGTQVYWDRRFKPWPPNISYRINPGGATLGTASLLLSMNAVMAAERRAGRVDAPFPALPRYVEATAGTVLVCRQPGEATTLEVYTTAKELSVKPHIASIKSSPHYQSSFHEITVPATAPGKFLRIQAPARHAMHVLTCTGAKVALVAPQGFPVAAYAESGRWFFKSAPDRGDFTVECADPQYLALRSPAGRAVEFPAGKATSHRVRVASGERGRAWSIAAKQATFVKLSGIRPVFAFRDPEQLSDAAGIQMAVEPSKTVAATRYTDGFVGKGLNIGDGEHLVIPIGQAMTPTMREHFNAEQGTLEFWFRPDWPYFLSPCNLRRTILLAPGVGGEDAVFNVHYVRVRRTAGPMAYDIRGGIQGLDAGIGNWGRKQARWMPGDWVHVAIEWGGAKRQYELRYYINGQPDGNKGHQQRWRRIRNFKPKPVAGRILIGGGDARGASLNGTFDELRISNVRRYMAKSFSPPKRLKADDHTLVLMRFESSLLAEIAGKGKRLQARIDRAK